jgi:hypothetical protein
VDGGTGGAPTGPPVGGATGALGAAAPPLVGSADVVGPADVPATAGPVGALPPAGAVGVLPTAGPVGVLTPAEPWARWLPVVGIDCVAVAGGVAPAAMPFDAASSPDEDSVRTEP